LLPGFACATSYVCNVHFAQCSVCSARHMHKAQHRQILVRAIHKKEYIALCWLQCVSGPVCFVHQLCSVFQSVCNVRATSKVCNANCANVVRFALCRMFQCPACSVHKLCSVPRQCAMCVQQARWALLRVLGVHCANVVCVQSVSVPRLPCAQAVYSAPSLCNVCVHTL